MVLSREEAGLGVVRVVVVLGFVVEEGVVLGSVGVGSGVDDDNELTVEGNGIICIWSLIYTSTVKLMLR